MKLILSAFCASLLTIPFAFADNSEKGGCDTSKKDAVAIEKCCDDCKACSAECKDCCTDCTKCNGSKKKDSSFADGGCKKQKACEGDQTEATPMPELCKKSNPRRRSCRFGKSGC